MKILWKFKEHKQIENNNNGWALLSNFKWNLLDDKI